MSDTKLYHAEFGFDMELPDCIYILRYTKHALTQANNDRYGKIKLKLTFDTRRATPIEVEIDSTGRISKIVYRVDYSDSHDAIYVIVPYNSAVKTVWLNEKSDTHPTLDASRYDNATKEEDVPEWLTSTTATN
jgi:hypothetical protein